MFRKLTPDEFNEHTNRIIQAAAGNGVAANDAVAATAKALGVLISFTARREKGNIRKLIALSQKSVATFAWEAETFMRNEGRTQAPPDNKWNVARPTLIALAIMAGLFVFTTVREGGTDLQQWMRNGSPYELLAYLFAYIAGIPLIVALVVFLRNRFVASQGTKGEPKQQ